MQAQGGDGQHQRVLSAKAMLERGSYDRLSFATFPLAERCKPNLTRPGSSRTKGSFQLCLRTKESKKVVLEVALRGSEGTKLNSVKVVLVLVRMLTAPTRVSNGHQLLPRPVNQEVLKTLTQPRLMKWYCISKCRRQRSSWPTQIA
eukprot:5645489-Amphidinium_carterae.1